jgi:aryl-alcohol dehydrogenase-like predicted oxidoreductase
VDLFQLHIPPQTEEDFANVEKAFREIKSEGKARYCGVSIGINYEKGIKIIERNLVDTIQLYFTLIDPKPLKELFPLAKKNKIGIIVAEPLAQGLLTNKYKPGHIFPKDDLRFHTYDPKLLQMKLERSQQFKFLINNNRTLNQVALSYVLSREEVSTCIPGSKSVEQLKSNVIASQVMLSVDELEKIEKIQQNWHEAISMTG